MGPSRRTRWVLMENTVGPDGKSGPYAFVQSPGISRMTASHGGSSWNGRGETMELLLPLEPSPVPIEGLHQRKDMGCETRTHTEASEAGALRNRGEEQQQPGPVPQVLSAVEIPKVPERAERRRPFQTPRRGPIFGRSTWTA